MFPSVTVVCEHLHSDPGCSQRFLPTPSAFRIPEKSPDKPRIGRFHPTSGYIYNLDDVNTFERMKHAKDHAEREKNPYFPFTDRDEWELAKFLYAHLTQTQINAFLKLHWVSSFIFTTCTIKLCLQVTSRSQTSFRSATELLSFLDAIPKGPTWHCTKIETEGYITKEPVYLFYRNALEVTQELFGSPVFVQHMEYDPYQIFKGNEREYGEWMSGDEAHRIQISALHLLLGRSYMCTGPTTRRRYDCPHRARI